MVATVLAILALLALGLLLWFAIRAFGEMLEKHEESELMCRNCKAKSIHASYPVGFVDGLFGLFGCTPYRCDVCSFRFYIRRPVPSQRVSTSMR
jgi:hypothetical protein